MMPKSTPEPYTPTGAQICEWCPTPARGVAFWQGDDAPHPSCGALGHGTRFAADAGYVRKPSREEVFAALDGIVDAGIDHRDATDAILALLERTDR